MGAEAGQFVAGQFGETLVDENERMVAVWLGEGEGEGEGYR